MDNRLLLESGHGQPKRLTLLADYPELAETLDVTAALNLTLGQWEALPEAEREWRLARWRQQQEHHSCGHPRHVCADATRQWYPQMDVCYANREQQAAWAAYERLHEKRPWSNRDMTSWSEKPDELHPYRFDHGVTVWAAETDLERGGNFTTNENPWADDGDELLEG